MGQVYLPKDVEELIDRERRFYEELFGDDVKRSKILEQALLDARRFRLLMKERNGRGEGRAAWSGGGSRR